MDDTPKPVDHEIKLTPAPAPRQFGPDELRWRCDGDCFGFDTTDELPGLEATIGQDRAVNAIRLGLEVPHQGYNIFVAGYAGTGKTTTVRRLLASIDRSGVQPTDKCFVNNFRDSNRPTMLTFAAGQARVFKQRMGELVDSLVRDLPQLFESKVFQERQQAIMGAMSDAESAMVGDLEKAVTAAGFGLVQVEVGPMRRPEVVFMHEGEPIRLDALQDADPSVSDARLAELKQSYQELSVQLRETIKSTRKNAREAKDHLLELRKSFASDVIDIDMSDLRDSYEDLKVRRYLDDVTVHVLDTLPLFEAAAQAEIDGDPFLVYGVNVLVDHSATDGAPIVFEGAPNSRSLLGTIERPADPSQDSVPDFMHIKSGAFLEADGGYLLFNISDAAHDPEVWPALKRTLKNGTLTIQAPETAFGPAPMSVKPQPIPIDVKVIVVGDLEIYHVLFELDDDFRKIFKVKAEFDSVMPRTTEAIAQMANFVRGRCREDKLLPFDRTGVSAVIEEGIGLTGRNDRISTRFSEVADVVREASYWAARESAPVVSEQHVDRAVLARHTRVNLIEDKVREAFMDGSLLMATDGEQVGTINGLTYLDGGDHGFGHPVRLTAVTAMGRAGIINIEREVELSGKTHSKGVLILEGFLRGRYAQDKPLSMSASIAFEQSYSSIDGDSASSTEIYALLSSLSGVPIRQGLAVTGSVNQHGMVQPIGSVNEKIDGFFSLCKKRGLTGRQGVLVPDLNRPDLMLRKEIVEAVKAGRFQIYPIRTIDEGLEVLTGVVAGERDAEGMFPEGTINRLVDDRLIELAEGLREFGEPPDTGDEDEREVE